MTVSDARTRNDRNPVPDVAASVLLLVGPLIPFLRYHGYPLARAEIVLIVGLTVLAGVLLGWAVHRAPDALRWVLLTILTVVSIDLLIRSRSPLTYLGVFAAAAVLLWLLRLRATDILAVAGLAFLIGSLLVPTPPVFEPTRTGAAVIEGRSDLPPVFHLVFDEHSGVAGIPSEELREELLEVYTRRGFRVFENAWSRHSMTHNSLPNLMNFAAEAADSAFLVEQEGENARLESNSYFAAMASRGYQIRVYQPAFLDLCNATDVTVSSCFTYAGNTIGYAASLDMPLLAKSRLVGAYFLSNQSYLFQSGVAAYRWLHRMLGAIGIPLPALDWAGDRILPPLSVVADAVLADAAGDSHGEFVFAHALPPHYPYMYDADCRANDRLSERLDAWSPHALPGQKNTEESRRRRYALYEDQVRCLLSELEVFLDSLEAMPGYADAVVILQGDHGSRISIARTRLEEGAIDRFSDRDLLDTYSTLFAIRAPSVAAGADTTRASVEELLRHLSSSDFGWSGLSRPSEPFVFLQSVNGETLRRAPYTPVMPSRASDPAPATGMPGH